MNQGSDAIDTANQRSNNNSNPVFATYVDHYTISNHQKLNSDLLTVIKSWRAESNGVKSSNQQGWHSPRTMFERSEPPFIELRHHIVTAMANSLKRYWPDFEPLAQGADFEGWVNCNSKGAFNIPHEHSGAHLSGSYYISVPYSEDSRSGALEFLNPIGVGLPTLPNGNPMMPTKLTLRPQEGLLVIFPAYLRHWVYPNLEDSERVSLAFNMKLLGPINNK